MNSSRALVPQKAKSRAALGRTYNRLTVASFHSKNDRSEWLVECRCSCGARPVLVLQRVMRGETKSCGCLSREVLALPTRQRVPSGKRFKCKSRESHRASQKKWVAKNPDKVAATAKRFRERHKEAVKAIKAAYYQDNRAKIVAKLIERYATDERFRTECLLRCRIRKLVRSKGATKAARTMELVGCDFDYLKAHLISLFTPGMSWDAVMSGAIHIDHVRPCASFDLSVEAEQRACFHWSNLQPLWAADNLKKGARLLGQS